MPLENPSSDGYRGMAQSGSAPGLGPGGRKFESCCPDHRHFPLLQNFALEFDHS